MKIRLSDIQIKNSLIRILRNYCYGGKTKPRTVTSFSFICLDKRNPTHLWESFKVSVFSFKSPSFCDFIIASLVYHLLQSLVPEEEVMFLRTNQYGFLPWIINLNLVHRAKNIFPENKPYFRDKYSWLYKQGQANTE